MNDGDIEMFQSAGKPECAMRARVLEKSLDF